MRLFALLPEELVVAIDVHCSFENQGCSVARTIITGQGASSATLCAADPMPAAIRRLRLLRWPMQSAYTWKGHRDSDELHMHHVDFFQGCVTCRCMFMLASFSCTIITACWQLRITPVMAGQLLDICAWSFMTTDLRVSGLYYASAS